eukprot:526522_1
MNSKLLHFYFVMVISSVQIPFVSGDECLGFYWGKSPNQSHFIFDWNHINVLLITHWIFALITTFWTIFWLWYHTTTVPSYKFEFHWVSKISLRIHIVTGSLEFILLYIAYFFPYTNALFYAIIYGIVVLDVIHGITGYIQIANVYGQKYLTVPSYIWVITFKILISLNLLMEPLSRERLWTLYESHSQFTWFRFLWYIFLKLNMFRDSLYTVTMFASVCIVQSFICNGSEGILIYVLYTVVMWLLLKKIKPSFVLGGEAENSLNSAYYLTSQKLDGLVQQLSTSNSLKEKCGIIFEYMDRNNNGTLDLKEFSELFTHCGVNVNATKRIFEKIDMDHNDEIDINEFIENTDIHKLCKQFECDMKEEIKARYATDVDKIQLEKTLISKSKPKKNQQYDENELSKRTSDAQVLLNNSH